MVTVNTPGAMSPADLAAAVHERIEFERRRAGILGSSSTPALFALLILAAAIAG